MTTPIVRLTALLALLLALPGGVLRSAAPPPPGWTDLVKERGRLIAEANHLQKEGKLAEAAEVVERVLQAERRLFGPVHAEVAGSLDWLAKLHERRGDFKGVAVRKNAGCRDWRRCARPNG